MTPAASPRTRKGEGTKWGDGSRRGLPQVSPEETIRLTCRTRRASVLVHGRGQANRLIRAVKRAYPGIECAGDRFAVDDRDPVYVHALGISGNELLRINRLVNDHRAPIHYGKAPSNQRPQRA